MTSENESKKPKIEGLNNRRAKIARLLEDYTNQMGLNIRPSSDVEKFLNLSQAEVRQMTAEECGEASYIIAKAITYIQLQVNRMQADINWCESYIQFVISKTIQTVGGQYMPHEMKRVLAIKQDDSASEAHRVIVQAKLKLDSLAFVASQLRSMVSAFEGLQQTKRIQK